MGGKTNAVLCVESTESDKNSGPSIGPEEVAHDTEATLEWLRRWREERYPLAPVNVLRLMNRSFLQSENLGLTAEEYRELKIQAA